MRRLSVLGQRRRVRGFSRNGPVSPGRARLPRRCCSRNPPETRRSSAAARGQAPACGWRVFLMRSKCVRPTPGPARGISSGAIWPGLAAASRVASFGAAEDPIRACPWPVAASVETGLEGRRRRRDSRWRGDWSCWPAPSPRSTSANIASLMPCLRAGGGVRGGCNTLVVGGRDGDVDHFLGQRIERAGRHHVAHLFPGPPERVAGRWRGPSRNC